MIYTIRIPWQNQNETFKRCKYTLYQFIRLELYNVLVSIEIGNVCSVCCYYQPVCLMANVNSNDMNDQLPSLVPQKSSHRLTG